MFSIFFARFAAVCSFLSKENSAVLPVALALTDIWFFDSAWTEKSLGHVPENRLESARGSCCRAAFILLLRIHSGAAQNS